MFDTIILLSEQIEQSALATLLAAFNPMLQIIAAASAGELCDIDIDVLHRARLIAFTTTVIVPAAVLDRLGYGAYNFHPGPPEYPGWAPAHFALFDRAPRFGVTVHRMVEKVDAGDIVRVDRFDVPPRSTVEELEATAYVHLARLFWEVAGELATGADPLPALPERWSSRKNSRRHYAALCDIPVDISKEELARRLAVFGQNHFGMMPTVWLHGVEFRAIAPAAQASD